MILNIKKKYGIVKQIKDKITIARNNEISTQCSALDKDENKHGDVVKNQRCILENKKNRRMKKESDIKKDKQKCNAKSIKI